MENVPRKRPNRKRRRRSRAPSETDAAMPQLVSESSSDDSDAEDAALGEGKVATLRTAASPSPAPTVVQEAEPIDNGLTREDDHGHEREPEAAVRNLIRKPRQALLTNMARGQMSTWLKRHVPLATAVVPMRDSVPARQERHDETADTCATKHGGTRAPGRDF